MRLEQEVDIGTKLYALSGGHGEEAVVVQHRVEGLYPFWVNVSVAHNPGLGLQGLLHHLTRAGCQHTVRPLARVHVNVPKELEAKKTNEQTNKEMECKQTNE